ncbi:hypothetical protein EMUCRT_0948 [Ehrlichia cf. muris str. EmCRT]|uniref:Uncharacterized protein n=1 Tax=Ehrlichia cf. muris str. EmCRT TaxID=1359167 RepID=A0A0F3N5W6_9RICK|nr:hypothetical protein EMUCRT_0944 [Ehrlichia cf. muris str. EmCRT]KJV63491.1 hypothetical protein EMUCRT_0946 [Ehrlichia cf. muris str. EmCRT]KJV63493.1 hypothetical protein EMUCRT_0948 [Ehrlichia cf. muris str. EmCRT]
MLPHVKNDLKLFSLLLQTKKKIVAKECSNNRGGGDKTY